MVKTMRKQNLKIQMLAGNNLNSCPDSRSQEKPPLVLLVIVIDFDHCTNVHYLPAISIRVQLTFKQSIATSTFFNTSFVEPPKPDFSQKKAKKPYDRESPRLQRTKKICSTKKILLDFSPNWTILSHLAKFRFLAFFGLYGLFGLI